MKIAIRKRRRRRTNKSGRTIIQVRYVLDYMDPGTGKRRQLFFESQDAAIAERESIIERQRSGFLGARDVTIAEAYAHWVKTKALVVRRPTLAGYRKVERYVVGPLVLGTAQERRRYAMGRTPPQDVVLKEMLGRRPASQLMTWEIRQWHTELCELVSPHTARLAKGVLHAVLKLAAEDFGVRTPMMPSGLGRVRDKAKKRILTMEQGKALLMSARHDPVHGIHVAFPFLTGMRPSEQLGLMWDDVDLDGRTIVVRRAREVRGSIVNETKTPAGFRRVPICDTLLELLSAWQEHWGDTGPGCYSSDARAAAGISPAGP